MSEQTGMERFRAVLNERGVEWRSGLEGVTFVGDWCFVEYDNGKLAATCEPVLTPEQAIAVTLGEKPRDRTEEWLLKACNLATQDYVAQLEQEVNELKGKLEAATLGSDASAVRLAERLRGIADEMRSVGASSMTPHDLLACYAREVDKVADSLMFAATLGRSKAKSHPYGYERDTGAYDATRCECGCINDISATYCNDCGGDIEIDESAEKEYYDGYSKHTVFAKKHDDGSLEFCERRYVPEDAVTLGGGTITAEQVREAIEQHSAWVIGNNRCFHNGAYVAIADELNAKLGSTTYAPKWTLQGETQTQEFWGCECGNCGYGFGVEDRSSFPFKVTIDKVDIPNFCPECGAKQKKEVDS